MSRDLIFIVLSLLVWGLGEGAFFSFQPLYLQQLGASPIDIGAILGAFSLAGTLAHIPAGYLADRIGRRPLMWAGWFIGLSAAWLMALANTLPVFTAGMILYGMTMFVNSPMTSYVTSARGSLRVGRALTLVSTGYNLGAVVGPLLGGWIGENYGYRSIFLFSACIFVVSVIFVLLIRSQPVEARANLQIGDKLINNPQYLRFMGLVFLAAFAMFLPQPLAPNYLQNQKDLSLVAIGQLYSISALGVIFFNLVLGQMEHRLGYLLGQAAVGVFALLIWQQTGMLWYGLAYFFVGGYRTARFLALAQVQTLVHPANMGLAYGLSESIAGTANILVPVLAGFLYAQSPEIIYPISLVLIAISIAANAAYLYSRHALKAQPTPTDAAT
jgi:MFS family permease